MPEIIQAPLWVVIATPLGKGGEGGIDRMMDGVRGSALAERQKNFHLSFGATRGRSSIWISPFYLASFILRVVW
jgi:hypothetical protein